MKPRLVQARNPIVPILITVILLAAIGGGGYLFFMQQQEQQRIAFANAATATSDARQATAGAIEATSAAGTAVVQATSDAGVAALERQYQAAVAFQAASDYEQARAALRELIQANPGYKDAADRLRQVSETLAEAYYQQGIAAAEARLWADAVANFDLALGVIPNYQDAAARRATAARELNVTPTARPTATTGTTPTALTEATIIAAVTTPEAGETTPETPAITPESTLEATVAPTAEGFRDTFDVAMRPEWETIQSGVSVVNGTLTGPGLILYDPKASNYVMRATVYGTGFQILFRSSSKGDKIEQGYSFFCYEDIMGRPWCKWLIYDPKEGSKDLSQSFLLYAIEDKEPDKLMFEIEGADFVVYMNDEPLSSIRDTTWTTGKVGIRTNGVAVDDFEVTPR
jgi:tetratricopeptide (TPR) repeat protein